MRFHARLLRHIMALLIFSLSIAVWTRHSDVLELIARGRAVLCRHYSQGRFGALLVSTPILWTLAAAFASRRSLRAALIDAMTGIFTTLFAALAITYFAYFFRGQPRYIETPLDRERAHSMQLAGAVRHRPPHQIYDLTYVDAPAQARSYPHAPPGYPPIPLRLTSDANGFRNLDVLPRYDLIAIGDSFVAGSNVSDDQTWPALLANAVHTPIYNLGVGGSGPPTYFSNFVYFGLRLKPRVALFMIYEGNDFKENVVLAPREPALRQRVSEHFAKAMKDSPVTKGLDRVSKDILEKIGAARPLPHYGEKLGFMPIAIRHGDSVHFYSFEPNRLVYLDYSADAFENSAEWQATARILRKIIEISRDNNIAPVFIYAPSAPHVLLPLARDAIPAEQLRYFAGFKKKNLPQPAPFKQRIYDNLDSEQNVMLKFCGGQGIDCLALTDALRRATADGVQTYFTYDQHWTPDGHRIAATTIEQFLREKGYL